MTISAEWLVGFVEGEGVFTVEIMKSTSRTGYTILPRFQLSVHKKDRTIVEQIHQILGVGEVRDISMERLRVKGVKASDQCMYDVTRLCDCFVLKKFFEEHPLQSSKKKAFAKWSEILGIVKLGQHATKGGLLKIAKIRDEMNPRLKNSKYRDYAFLLKDLSASSVPLENF